MFLSILIYAALICTVIHAIKHLPSDKTWKTVLWAALIVLTSPIGIVCYWIYYAVKRPERAKEIDIARQPADDSPAPSVPEYTADDDGESGRSRELFRQAMHGAKGKELSKCYDKLMDIFILQRNGECKGGGFTGKMYETDRAKRIAAIDDKTVVPALGNDPEMYEAWWRTLYEDVFAGMQNSPNPQQAEMLSAVISDVRRGDDFLEKTCAWEHMLNPREGDVETLVRNVELTDKNGKTFCSDVILVSKNGGRTIKIKTDEGSYKIKHKTERGIGYYEITDVYRYFRFGLSDDDLVRTAEMLIAVPSILQCRLQYGANKVWMEKYGLPSLSKLQKK